MCVCGLQSLWGPSVQLQLAHDTLRFEQRGGAGGGWRAWPGPSSAQACVFAPASAPEPGPRGPPLDGGGRAGLTRAGAAQRVGELWSCCGAVRSPSGRRGGWGIKSLGRRGTRFSLWRGWHRALLALLITKPESQEVGALRGTGHHESVGPPGTLRTFCVWTRSVRPPSRRGGSGSERHLRAGRGLAPRWPAATSEARLPCVSGVLRGETVILERSPGMASVTTTSSLTALQNPRLGAVTEQ